MEHKDALTDLVEYIQGATTPSSQGSSGGREVTNSQGEIITLGYDGRGKVVIENKGKSLELSVEDIARKISEHVYNKIVELIGKENLDKPIKLKIKVGEK